MAKEMLEAKFFTEEELALHDGSDESKPLLLCVQGMIFDVTPARSFYGPGGPYAVFAGKECARALALMSTQATDCRGDVSDLPDDKKAILRDWQRKFLGKYPVVGAMQGAAWDTSTMAHNKVAPQHTPSGHNAPLIIAAASVLVAGAAWVVSLAVSGKASLSP